MSVCAISASDAIPWKSFERWQAPLQLGHLELATRFTLAPLAGYTNLPLRLSMREVGGLGLATTDLVNARAVLEGSQRTLELLATCTEDRPLAVQIYGARPDDMIRCAQRMQEYGATIIDINMGCPVRKIVKGGGGSAMMCDTTGATVDLVRKVVESVAVPVTVKMRLGWDDENLSAPYFARLFEQAGVAAVTIHGRTRAQGFSGAVNLDGIRAVVETVERMPVIGNGDVRTIADAQRMLLHTGCAGIAIGRGALANPWIFRQLSRWLQTGEPGPRGTFHERLDFMSTHLRRLIEWRGEHFGCLQFRKVSTWYTKALRAGRAVQQALVQLGSWATFSEIVDRLREQGPPPGWGELDAAGPHIHVPSGPIAHW